MALVEAATFRPDLLLLDVNLPGIDGFGIAMRIRHMDGFKRTPIIFLTARDRPSASSKRQRAILPVLGFW
jgi:two-component system OmpR family response regulator